jgi:hypothetical protein
MQPPKTLSLTPTQGQFEYSVQQIGKILAGNVSFGASTNNTDQDINMDCFKATGTTPGTANTEFSISHQLGRIPVGFLVASVDQAAIIYKSTTAWTSSHIYLKCNVASVNYFVILI